MISLKGRKVRFEYCNVLKMMYAKEMLFSAIVEKFVTEEIMTKSQFQDWYHKEKKDDRCFIATMIIGSAIGLAGVMVELFQMVHH